MMKVWLLLLLGLIQAPLYAFEVAGVDIPERIEVADGRQLLLNGAGIRSKFFIKVYVGALYLSQRAETSEQVYAIPGAKRVSMHFLYDELKAEKLVKAWNEGFENNLNETQRSELAQSIKAFNKLFPDVKAGDVITIDLQPVRGTRVSLNGEQRGLVAGEAFQRALLSIWLGEEPADEELKAAMLGN